MSNKTAPEKNMFNSHPATRQDDKRLKPVLGDGRGRKKMNSELKRVVAHLTFAPAVLAQADQAAESAGISRSEWVERAVMAALAQANGGK